MIDASRRRFLRMLGATTAAGLWPAGVQRAWATPAHRATGTIADVGHVVILMQENRSFDHYFGSLRGVRGFGDPRPLQLPSGQSVWHQPPARTHTWRYYARGVPRNADCVLPFPIDHRANHGHQRSTDHGWSSGHQAWNEGHWNQWVEHKQDTLTMGYLRRADLPFHYALADAFTLCDHYFSSVHADTAPNRIYLWSGTIDPRNVHGRRPNGPGLDERSFANGYTWTTYPERLQQQGVSWRVYQGGTGDPGSPTDRYSDNALEFFAAYQVGENALPDSPLVMRGTHSRTLAQLRQDVLNNELPQVSWIVAPYKYCEHPKASPDDGAYFVNRVLDALTANPAVWSKTVLFLNYDENDGLFDHVVPPMPPPPGSGRNQRGMVSASLQESLADEFLDLDQYPHVRQPLVPGTDPGGLQPIGLGARVPMLVISPWTTGGWVCSQTFDHTSVLRFLEARFGVPEPNISAWRRSVCGDLTSAFDFSRRPSLALPSLPLPSARDTTNAQPIMVPDTPALPMQEPGVRPARALPYQWSVRHTLARPSTEHTLTLDNQGAAGVAFYVYDDASPDALPRRYTVASGDRLHDAWPLQGIDLAYGLRVHGPNGSLFHARGRAGAQASLDVKLDIHAHVHTARLTLHNDGVRACECSLVNAYAPATARRLQLAPGERHTVDMRLCDHGWYDLAVTLRDDAHYLRRHAGHVEDGKPSISDPGPPMTALGVALAQ